MNRDAAATAGTARFTLVSRVDCHLCEVMLEELGRFLGGDLSQLTVVDVDGNEELRRRFGLKVPVLLFDGEIICHGRFDPAEVSRLARSALSGPR